MFTKNIERILTTSPFTSLPVTAVAYPNNDNKRTNRVKDIELNAVITLTDVDTDVSVDVLVKSFGVIDLRHMTAEHIHALGFSSYTTFLYNYAKDNQMQGVIDLFANQHYVMSKWLSLSHMETDLKERMKGFANMTAVYIVFELESSS